ncbi:MAG: PASTA domain-containing protein [Flavobacteriales bacterium]|jgi:beta-lactam-binding protein with PASTA domain
MTSFFKSNSFRKAILGIAITYTVLLLGSWFWLQWYTDHGQYVSVPELKGLSTEEAIKALQERNLDYLVIDSIYDRKAVPGSVFDQSPAFESQVKEGRQVFLTIYRLSPPMEKLGIKQGDYATVAMIKLRNKSIDFDTLYEDNNTLANSIIRVTQRGKTLKASDEVARGSKVMLVIGRSVSDKIIVPDFTGMTCLQAKTILDTLRLECNCRFEPGISSPSAQDSSSFFVCRQDPIHDPERGTSAGRIVDLWLYNTPCAPDSIQP